MVVSLTAGYAIKVREKFAKWCDVREVGNVVRRDVRLRLIYERHRIGLELVHLPEVAVVVRQSVSLCHRCRTN